MYQVIKIFEIELIWPKIGKKDVDSYQAKIVNYKLICSKTEFNLKVETVSENTSEDKKKGIQKL